MAIDSKCRIWTRRTWYPRVCLARLTWFNSRSGHHLIYERLRSWWLGTQGETATEDFDRCLSTRLLFHVNGKKGFPRGDVITNFLVGFHARVGSNGFPGHVPAGA